jgi:hypothetical protein
LKSAKNPAMTGFVPFPVARALAKGAHARPAQRRLLLFSIRAAEALDTPRPVAEALPVAGEQRSELFSWPSFTFNGIQKRSIFWALISIFLLATFDYVQYNP